MGTAAAPEKAKRHFAAGQFGLAIESFGAVVETDPTSVTALNGLAASYDRIGRHELAGRFYRQALWLDPKSSQTLNNIGYSYYLQGKLDLALAYLRERSCSGRRYWRSASRLQSTMTRLSTPSCLFRSSRISHLTSGSYTYRLRRS